MALTFQSNDIYSGGSFTSCTDRPSTSVGSSDNICCPIAWAATGSGPDSPYQAVWRKTQNVCIQNTITLHVVWDFYAVNANSLDICTGSTFAFSTFCVTGSGSANVTIPAGTTNITYYLVGSCNGPIGGGDLWSVTTTCL